MDSKQDLKEIFTHIYDNNVWVSPDRNVKYYSGGGSHEPQIVLPYVEAVTKLLGLFSSPPNVVDLGCGDFAVGSKYRHACNRYIACDIVDGLIEHNKVVYKDLNVDFRVLNIVEDEIPDGDIVFIRQVLQHLSNASIKKIIDKVSKKFKHIVITDNIHSGEDAVPNIDIEDGHKCRHKSGVVLTQPPFNLKPSAEFRICAVNSIVTTLYLME